MVSSAPPSPASRHVSAARCIGLDEHELEAAPAQRVSQALGFPPAVVGGAGCRGGSLWSRSRLHSVSPWRTRTTSMRAYGSQVAHRQHPLAPHAQPASLTVVAKAHLHAARSLGQVDRAQRISWVAAPAHPDERGQVDRQDAAPAAHARATHQTPARPVRWVCPESQARAFGCSANSARSSRSGFTWKVSVREVKFREGRLPRCRGVASGRRSSSRVHFGPAGGRASRVSPR